VIAFPKVQMEIQPFPDTSRLLSGPQTISRRIPINLADHDRDLFAHEFQKSIPETYLRELNDVRVSPDGILFRRGRILAESFAFPFLQNEWKYRSVLKFLASNYLLRKTRNLEKAAWIIDEWSTGYFHWLTDALSKLVLIRNDLSGRILLLPHHYEAFDFVAASLKAFDVQAFEFINEDVVVRCERLLLPTPVAPSGNYREEIIQAVRSVLLTSFGETSSNAPSDRLYISRAKAQKRKIANEEELIGLLHESGFKVIHAEDLSFADQVRIASGTRFLISNHGAALTNMLFMNSGASVLELRHKADRTNNCYFTLSSALNLNYFYQTCDSPNSEENAHTANLIVDTGRLRQNLRMMLEHKSR
jgi:capsular polysaccharide biosynthesis protein